MVQWLTSVGSPPLNYKGEGFRTRPEHTTWYLVLTHLEEVADLGVLPEARVGRKEIVRRLGANKEEADKNASLLNHFRKVVFEYDEDSSKQ